MELNIKSSPVEKSADFQEQFFGMGDLSVVMTILRSKLYSNPIKIVVQEILVNARDAHREVGKSDIPVKVTLPSALNPNFEVQDFGPGITPDRMVNVFIRYGASTKRDDNTQTGGFGLGAKSPFSYTDSFVIETITEGKKRVYVAYIDESSVGKMSLLSTEDTIEGNGTTIKIPVKSEDFRSFQEHFTSVTEYWDIRPTVEDRIYWEDVPSYKTRKTNFWFEQGTYEIKVLIDKIPYTFTKDKLFGVDFSKYPEVNREMLQKLFEFGFCFEVPCGVLTVSANREQIEINDKNLRTLFKIIQETTEQMYSKFQEDLNEIPSYQEAITYLFQRMPLFQHLNKDSKTKITWRGQHIPSDLKFHFEYFNRFDVKVYESKQFVPEKIKLVAMSSKSLEKKNIFVVRDTQSNFMRRLIKLAETEKDKDIVVLTPAISNDILRDYFTEKTPKSCIQKHLHGLFANYGGYQCYDIRYVSDLDYDKTPRATRLNPPRKLVKLLKATTSISNMSLDDMLKDPTIKIFYVCTNYKSVISPTNTFVSFDKDDFVNDFSEVIHRVCLKSDEKLAIFGCSKRIYQKYYQSDRDIFKYVMDTITKNVPAFLLHESKMIRTCPSNQKFWSDCDFEEFVFQFNQYGTSNNLTVNNLFKTLNKFNKFQKETRLARFLFRYNNFFNLPYNKKSSFLAFFCSTLEKYPLIKYVNFDNRGENMKDLVKYFSDYINFVDSGKNL